MFFLPRFSIPDYSGSYGFSYIELFLENPTEARGTSRPQRVHGGVSASLMMKQLRSEWY